MRIAMREALTPFAADGVIEDIVEAVAETLDSVRRESTGELGANFRASSKHFPG